jgi:cell division protein FtsB
MWTKKRKGHLPILARVVAFLAIPFFFHVAFIQPVRAQYYGGQRRMETLEMERNSLRQRVREGEVYLQRFADDAGFREYVIRERLGYADEGEFVYVFEE